MSPGAVWLTLSGAGRRAQEGMNVLEIRDFSTEAPGEDDSDVPSGSGPEVTDFRLILNAPDFATFVKRPKNARVREYEKRTASALKTLAFGAMQNENFADAAAVLWHGPAIATAAGHVADTSDRARNILDMVTAPNSPWMGLALTGMALVGQLARNHEKELQEVPKRFAMGRKARAARKAAKEKQETPQTPPRFTMRIGKWHIPVRFRFRGGRLLFSGIRANTQEPTILTSRVFTNEELLTELRKMGFNIQPGPPRG